MQTGKIYKGETLISGGGANGKSGLSAYELWIAAGHTGSVADFLASLKGDAGVVIDEETFLGTIVNDLTTGGSDKALSAEMGKELEGMFHYRSQVVEGAMGYYSTNASSYPSARNASNTVYSAKVDVQPGDRVIITGEAGSSNYYRLWATYASDGTRADRYDSSGTYRETPYVLTVPTGIAHVVVNIYNYNSATDSIVKSGSLVNFDELAEGLSSVTSAVDEEITKQKYMQILISKWGSSFTLSIGQFGFRSDTKVLRYNIGDGQGGNRIIDVPFYEGAVYRYGNALYYWDSTNEAMTRFDADRINVIENSLTNMSDAVASVGKNSVGMVIGSLLTSGSSQGLPPATLFTTRARCNEFLYPPFSVRAKDGYRIYATYRYASNAVLDTTKAVGCWTATSYIRKVFDMTTDDGYKYRFVIAKEDTTEQIEESELTGLVDFKSGLFLQTDTESGYGKYYVNTEKAEFYTDYASLISAYDSMANSFQDQVTKRTLGTTDQNVAIYEYVISTGNYNKAGRRGTLDSELSKPIFGIMSGTHGYERASVNGLYYIFRDILSGVPALTTLMDNAEIHIIPCLCPWGFDNNSRTNYNGVNLNRNFSAGWYEHDQGSRDYSGPSASSEKETQIAEAWIDSMHALGANLVIDWHNSGYGEEISCFASCTNNIGGTQDIKKSYLHSVNALSSVLIRVNSVRKDAIWAYSCTADGAGYANKYMDSIGQLGCFFETSYNVDNQATYSVNTAAVGASVMGNALLGWSELLKIK